MVVVGEVVRVWVLQGDRQITVQASFLRRQRSDSLENSRVRKLGYFTVFLPKRFCVQVEGPLKGTSAFERSDKTRYYLLSNFFLRIP